MSTLDLVTRLSLVFLLLKPAFAWYANVPVLVLAVCGLLFPELGRRPVLWLALTGLTATKLVTSWSFVDNHFFLVTYWCLALACCLATRTPEPALARSARALVAGTFLFAVAWKLLWTRDWIRGHVFRDLLLTDPRFADLGRLFGGMDAETLAHNSSVLAELLHGDRVSGLLHEPPGLVRLAAAATAWTTLIELAVALTFLWPLRGRLAALRHAALLAFCWTTYAFGTVTGFGWMLVILGLAQCEAERRVTRWLYVATFFLILAYARVPWSEFLVGLSGG